MRTATTVGALLNAAHHDSRGRIHGHTWTVWARFEWAPHQPPVDALELQARLRHVVALWDHSLLHPDNRLGEDLARLIAEHVGADYVRLERLAEMIVAEWWAE